jgi:hypothetical protein
MTSASSRVAMVRSLTWLAESQLLAGLIDDGLDSAEQALQANPQDIFSRPASLQVRGDLRARKGLSAKAEQDFRDVMDLSIRMGARRFYDRAAESLHRLTNG